MAGPELSDDECVAKTAAGDHAAYAILWSRHCSAAYTVARSYRSLDTDDLVAESFAKVFRAILNGGGPTTAFRAYLFTTIRNTAATQLKRSDPLSIERDLDYETIGELSIPGVDASDASVASRAFAALPLRWQQVLWYVGVEELSAAEAAPILGMTPNAVSALAMRARRGFRRELVIVQSAELPDESLCKQALTSHLEQSASRARRQRAEDGELATHVDECNKCRGILGDSGRIDERMAIILMSAVVGAAAVSYLALLAAPGLLAEAGGAVGAAGAAGATAPPPTTTPVVPPVVVGALVAVALTAAAVAGVVAANGGFSGPPAPSTADAAAPADANPAPDIDDPPTVSEPEPARDEVESPVEPPVNTPGPDVTPTPPPGHDDDPDDNPDDEAPDEEDPVEPPAAPPFTLVLADTPYYGEITGTATPGWTVEAMVTRVNVGITASLSRASTIADTCEAVTSAEGSTLFSTTAAEDGSWALTFSELEAGDYSVVVRECTVSDGVVSSSAYSTPAPFTVQAPPTVRLTKMGAVHVVSITGVPNQQVAVLGRFVTQLLTLNASGRATTVVLTSSPEVRYTDGTRFGPRAVIVIDDPDLIDDQLNEAPLVDDHQTEADVVVESDAPGAGATEEGDESIEESEEPPAPLGDTTEGSTPDSDPTQGRLEDTGGGASDAEEPKSAAPSDGPDATRNDSETIVKPGDN